MYALTCHVCQRTPQALGMERHQMHIKLPKTTMSATIVTAVLAVVMLTFALVTVIP
jgi:hypothetical protein